MCFRLNDANILPYPHLSGWNSNSSKITYPVHMDRFYTNTVTALNLKLIPILYALSVKLMKYTIYMMSTI